MAVFNYLQGVITVLDVEPVEGVSLCREKEATVAVALNVQASEAVVTTIVVIHALHSDLEAVIDATKMLIAVTVGIICPGIVLAGTVTAGIEDEAPTECK